MERLCHLLAGTATYNPGDAGGRSPQRGAAPAASAPATWPPARTVARYALPIESDMAKFSLAEGVNRLSTEVMLGTESVVLEAGDVLDTDDPRVIHHLRSLGDTVVELDDKGGK